MSKSAPSSAQLLQAITRVDSLLQTALAQDPFHPLQQDWRVIQKALAEQLSQAAPAMQPVVSTEQLKLQRQRDQLVQTLQQVEQMLKAS